MWRMSRVRVASADEAAQLAWLAAVTFPSACPPSLSRDDIAQFLEDALSPEAFSRWIVSPDALVLVWGDLEGYAVVEFAAHLNAPEPWRGDASAYLSKLYLRSSERGGPAAQELMRRIIAEAQRRACVGVWLGVNAENARAQRFYEKSGFTPLGRRTFIVGKQRFDDVVLACTLAPEP